MEAPSSAGYVTGALRAHWLISWSSWFSLDAVRKWTRGFQIPWPCSYPPDFQLGIRKLIWMQRLGGEEPKGEEPRGEVGRRRTWDSNFCLQVHFNLIWNLESGSVLERRSQGGGVKGGRGGDWPQNRLLDAWCCLWSKGSRICDGRWMDTGRSGCLPAAPDRWCTWGWPWGIRRWRHRCHRWWRPTWWRPCCRFLRPTDAPGRRPSWGWRCPGWRWRWWRRLRRSRRKTWPLTSWLLPAEWLRSNPPIRRCRDARCSC